jgi:hypothetical protein
VTRSFKSTGYYLYDYQYRQIAALAAYNRKRGVKPDNLSAVLQSIIDNYPPYLDFLENHADEMVDEMDIS